MTVKYEIRAGKNAPCELVSVVKTPFGGNAVNFVTEGTHTHCVKVRDMLLTDTEGNLRVRD